MATAVKRRKRSKYDTVPYDLYDGSAVRQLRQEEVLQPRRPMVRPRERTLARPRIRVREAGAVSPFAVVGFLAVAAFSVLLLFSYVQLAVISDQVVSLRSELTTLKTEEAKLRAQYELAYDLDAIESGLSEGNTMVKPQNGQVIYVDLSEPDSVTYFENESGATGLSGAVEELQSIVTEIMEYLS